MAPIETSVTRPGLRERKKAQTRETIERAALKLFAARGFDQTTLAEIAEAADVSPRTIFSYFGSKEDILFYNEPRFHEQLKDALEQRPPGATTVDAIRQFIAELDPPDELARLRKQVICSDEALRLSERARHGLVEEALVASIAKDLDADPEDLRPQLAAASMLAAFNAVRDRLEAELAEPVPPEQTMAIIDEVLDFLRGGLEALQRD